MQTLSCQSSEDSYVAGFEREMSRSMKTATSSKNIVVLQSDIIEETCPISRQSFEEARPPTMPNPDPVYSFSSTCLNIYLCVKCKVFDKITEDPLPLSDQCRSVSGATLQRLENCMEPQPLDWYSNIFRFMSPMPSQLIFFKYLRFLPSRCHSAEQCSEHSFFDGRY